MVVLNLPRSGLVQHQDAEDGSKGCCLCRGCSPLLIWSVIHASCEASLDKQEIVQAVLNRIYNERQHEIDPPKFI
jgi:hypothetical protein